MAFKLSIAVPLYLLLYAGCYFGAYLLRFDFQIHDRALHVFSSTVAFVLAIKFVASLSTREWRRRFRYTSLKDMVYTGVGAAVASGVIFLVNGFGLLGASVPRSIIVIDFVLSLLATCLLRCSIRMALEWYDRYRMQARKRTVILDDGHGNGLAILKTVQSSPEFEVVGIVAPDADRKSLISGIPVYAGMQNLERIARSLNVAYVLVPGTMSGREVRELLHICESAGLAAHVIPAVDELVNGRFRLKMRDVQIADLLRREPARLDMEQIQEYVRGKRVLVSGGAGSIGSELCRQLAQLQPEHLVIVDQSESGVFYVEQELRRRESPAELHFVVADVANESTMSRVIMQHSPDIIFHAAAYKHVPLMEENPQEAIRNNVLGTRTMVDLADRAGVERFVLISTDKAVRPTNVMGSTKLLAEKYLQSVAPGSRTKFLTVRFGNVLDSVGSVVPTFRRQIEDGGPVTVTHPEMTRFFMTIPEAVQLVLQAGAIGESGDIMILDMGDPVRIFDLARDMILLSGLKYPDDIDIVFSGIRPGEKLFEELFYESEDGARKVHDQIFRAPRAHVDSAYMSSVMHRLENASYSGAGSDAAAILREIVAGYVHEEARRAAA